MGGLKDREDVARARRFLRNRDAKLNENPKTALPVRGQKTSGLIIPVLKAVQRPLQATMYSAECKSGKDTLSRRNHPRQKKLYL